MKPMRVSAGSAVASRAWTTNWRAVDGLAYTRRLKGPAWVRNGAGKLLHVDACRRGVGEAATALPTRQGRQLNWFNMMVDVVHGSRGLQQ
jgi:hypothetical protein